MLAHVMIWWSCYTKMWPNWEKTLTVAPDPGVKLLLRRAEIHCNRRLCRSAFCLSDALFSIGLGNVWSENGRRHGQSPWRTPLCTAQVSFFHSFSLLESFEQPMTEPWGPWFLLEVIFRCLARIFQTKKPKVCYVKMADNWSAPLST